MSKQKLSYLERLQQSPEEIEKEQCAYLNSQNKLQLESDLLATQQELSSKKQELNTLLRARELSSTDILKCRDEIDGLEGGEKALKELIKELFPKAS